MIVVLRIEVARLNLFPVQDESYRACYSQTTSIPFSLKDKCCLLDVIHIHGDHFYRSGINNNIYHLSDWHYGESSNQATVQDKDEISSIGHKSICKDNIKGSIHPSPKNRKYNDLKAVNNMDFFDPCSNKDMWSCSNSSPINKDPRAGEQQGLLTGKINANTMCKPDTVSSINAISSSVRGSCLALHQVYTNHSNARQKDCKHNNAQISKNHHSSVVRKADESTSQLGFEQVKYSELAEEFRAINNIDLDISPNFWHYRAISQHDTLVTEDNERIFSRLEVKRSYNTPWFPP